MLKYGIIVFFMLFNSTLAFAQGERLPHYSDLHINIPTDDSYFQFAANETPQAAQLVEANMSNEAEYEDRWFTANKVHQYLGLGSLAMAVLAGIAPKEEGEDDEDGGGNTGGGGDSGLHHEAGRAAMILGGAALATGIMFHYDDLQLKNGFSDPDNLHALYTLLGVLGYSMAVSEAPGGKHAGYGVLGAVVMTVGIKMTW